MPLKRPLTVFATLVLVSLPLAACSNSESASSTTGAGGSTSTSTSSASTTGTGAGGMVTTPTTSEILAASWKLLPNGPMSMGKQDDVYFTDVNAGWSVNGIDGQIFHTTDGGDTWTKQLEKAGTYFRAITFLDPMHGFASNIGTGYYPGVTDANPLYETTDGGATWAAFKGFQGPAPTGICNFNKLDATHIVGTGRVGGPSFFARSEDGGTTWTSADVGGMVAMLVDSYFVSPNEGYVTGGSTVDETSHCVIAHTADGGKSWDTTFTSKAAGEMCWKFSFPSANVGYASVLTFASGTSSTFLKTTDGGQTWKELPFLTTSSYAALGVGFINEDIGWLAGEAMGKPAYRTKDGGQTWQPDNSLGPYINRFRFVDPRTAYAIGMAVYKLEIE